MREKDKLMILFGDRYYLGL